MYNFVRPGIQIFIDALVNDVSQSSFIKFENFPGKPCNSRLMVFTTLKGLKKRFVPFVLSLLLSALRKESYVGFTE